MPPSEDLTDEIEAINSIYGDGTLVLVDERSKSDAQAVQESAADGAVAILAVPASADDVADMADTSAGDDALAMAHRLSLRLWFPPAYPACPESPAVIGVQSVGDTGGGGHRRPGAAARDVERFGAALTATFQEGQVCLFDAVEEFLRQIGDEAEAEEEEEEEEEREIEREKQRELGGDTLAASLPSQRELAAPPPWTIADPVKELKSTFVARCAPASSPAQAAAYIQHLKDTDRRVRDATHNMTAWRIRGEGGATYQDCDDDGETAAGGRLLHLMQLMDLWNVVVVVTRWYGGHKLGPRRFALINQAARDAFVLAGLVPTAEAGKKKGR